MKNLLAILALTFSLSGIAQDGEMEGKGKKTPEERAKHRTEVMTKELGLSPEQIARVNTVNITYARAIGEVKEMKDPEAKTVRSKALRETRDNDMKTILTADQFAKMVSLRDQKKDDHKGKKPHNE
jgi:periplasmic protein CpxP/Spy